MPREGYSPAHILTILSEHRAKEQFLFDLTTEKSQPTQGENEHGLGADFTLKSIP